MLSKFSQIIFSLLFYIYFYFQNDPNISLTSSYNYGRFNRIEYRSFDDDDEYQCDVMNSKLENKYSKFKEFCMQLTGNLKQYDKISLIGFDNSVKCTLLNLWMYDQIYDMLKAHDEHDPHKMMGQISDIWTKYSGPTNCVILYELDDKNNFIDNKKLYDYVLNHHYINIHLATKNHVCKKNFKDYLIETEKIYKTLKAQHKTEKGYNYCMILDDFEKIHPKGELLSQLPCVQIIENEVTPSRINEPRDSPAGPSREVIEPSVSTGELGIVGAPAPRTESGTPELQGPQLSPEMSEVAEAPSTIAGTASVSLIGVSAFSYLLYKVNLDFLYKYTHRTSHVIKYSY
ncbi:hypothetical protein PVMG_06036 [Plasmodium vivax Mauritania I]|uniref:Uncharacterized protein n=1 Tax=Plasmodium vivax Mauritania I TaxID=1035515 RepID=A0A0J9TF61_PLAVI|nr:hypothetical protein PVMG_06036 [Plasmodium vivax Mauritania I]